MNSDLQEQSYEILLSSEYFGSCCSMWFTYCSLVSHMASFVCHWGSRRTTGSSRRWFREYFQFRGHQLNTLNQHKSICATWRSPELSSRTGRRHGPGWKDNAPPGSLRNNFKTQPCPWINPYKLWPGLCCSPPRSCTLRRVLDCSENKQTAQWPISGFQVYAKRCNLLLFFRLMYYYFMYL